MKHLSIKERVAFSVALLVVAIMVVANMVQMQLLESGFVRIVSDQQASLVARVTREIDSKFETGAGALSATAAFMDERDLADPRQIRKQFAERPSLLALFDDLLVQDSKGTIVTDFPELAGRAGLDASDREYFRQVVAGHVTVISEPVLSRTRHEPIVNVATPIMARDGRLAGVLVGVIRLYRSTFLGALGDERIGKAGYFVVLTRGAKPIYVAHPDRNRIMQPRPANGSRAVTDAANGFEGTAEGVSSQGVQTFYTSGRLRAVPWVLIAGVPKAELYAPLKAAEQRLWLLAGICALVVVPLVWLIVRWLLAPLHLLRLSMIGLREGEGDFTPIPVHRADEVGAITRQFNELMRKRLGAEKAQRDSEERLRLVADNVPALISYVDAELRVRFANSCYREWFGLDPAGMIGKRVDEVFPGPEYQETVVRYLERALLGEASTYERRIATRAGERFVRTSFFPRKDRNGPVIGIYHLSTDITADRKLQAELDRLARRDSLTRLHNRLSFLEILPKALARMARQRRWMAVLFVDLDRFKEVNDTRGHDAGDEVLKAVAGRLMDSVRVTDTVARLGGDEFTVILEGLAAPEEAATIATKIITALSEPFDTSAGACSIGASIGIATSLGDAIDPDALLKRADAAAYAAKNAGRGRYEVAEPLVVEP
ncbi:MAG TPA: diguanylate cyclase [Usitatibacter sp.]|jgi:diguanylate cyclase (GGDEF)-like protein/PAS domain S-box-containing protein|nr:diguanylate cyclase [Usitatibacter sp.]